MAGIRSGTTIDTTRFKETLSQKFQEFTFLGILLARLADGINPCAIATMIFLISFLAIQNYNTENTNDSRQIGTPLILTDMPSAISVNDATG